MFETLQKATLDKIFVLMAEYAADPRTNKIDLGVGVYKDAGIRPSPWSSVLVFESAYDGNPSYGVKCSTLDRREQPHLSNSLAAGVSIRSKIDLTG